MGSKPKPPKAPIFFKILFDDFSDRLKIPPVFVKRYFNGVLPLEFVLKGPDKRFRRVNVRKIGNLSFFEQGWRLFVQDNFLQHGDFLVFHYDGNSEFNVSIFGKNGCEKEIAVARGNSKEVIDIYSDCTSNETGPSSPHDEFKSKDFHSLEDNLNESMPGKKATPLVRQVTSKSSFSRTATQGKEEASKFISEHPFFELHMTRRYLNGGGLHIPKSFAKQYFEVGEHSVMLRDSTGSWPVKLICKTNHLAWFSAGTAVFLKNNTYQVGDVCIFELIERNDIVLKVSIIK